MVFNWVTGPCSVKRIKTFEPRTHGQQPNQIFETSTATVQNYAWTPERAYPAVAARRRGARCWRYRCLTRWPFSLCLFGGPLGSPARHFARGGWIWSRTDQLADVLLLGVHQLVQKCRASRAEDPNNFGVSKWLRTSISWRHRRVYENKHQEVVGLKNETVLTFVSFHPIAAYLSHNMS
jgi:hypothetical protein